MKSRLFKYIVKDKQPRSVFTEISEIKPNNIHHLEYPYYCRHVYCLFTTFQSPSK